MTFDSVLNLFKNIVDVLLVWLVLYFVLKSLSKNVKMALLFKGIVFIIILKIHRKETIILCFWFSHKSLCNFFLNKNCNILNLCFK